MHEVVPGKLFAFKGPSDTPEAGHFTFEPQDLLEVFYCKDIRTVVRLNDRHTYNASAYVDAGIAHHDLEFEDCTTPPDRVVDKFLRICESAEGGVAVHCLAGLGRTGTLIGLYMMKHQGFTAREAIAWLRIVRPGSVIGPQQRYLVAQEDRMHALAGAAGLGEHMAADAEERSGDVAAQLAAMVRGGMLSRDARTALTATSPSGSESPPLLTSASRARSDMAATGTSRLPRSLTFHTDPATSGRLACETFRAQRRLRLPAENPYVGTFHRSGDARSALHTVATAAENADAEPAQRARLPHADRPGGGGGGGGSLAPKLTSASRACTDMAATSTFGVEGRAVEGGRCGGSARQGRVKKRVKPALALPQKRP